MLENLLRISSIERRHFFAFILSFVYTLIGAFTAFFLFKDFMSIAMLFFATLLLLPTLMSYLSKEEKIERQAGLKHFFRNHKDIFETYFFVFLGCFIGFMLIGIFAYSVHYDFNSYQFNFLSERGVTPDGVSVVPESNLEGVLNIVVRNVTVDIIAFILSVAYGAGAIFLIVYNASIFASFIVLIIKYLSESVSHAAAIFATMLIHIVPEISGFLLAAIAGGVISKALTREKFGSDSFKNVVRDGAVMFLISILLIIFAAFLEIYVTRGVFRIL